MTAIREEIRRMLLDAGAAAAGFARAETIDPAMVSTLDRWYAAGCHAGMDYMPRHALLRRDPRTLLDGARTVISVAIPYLPATRRDPALPQIAMYAYGRDYHRRVVSLLRPVCRHIREHLHADTRICVDTAPVAERYWALRAGIGIRALNGTVIVPPYGSYVFLAEILTTLDIVPDTPSSDTCTGCGACLRACPGQAIRPDGTIDARRCLSYLTIEHRGTLTSGQQAILDTPQGRNTIYGCDICQRVCPHNRDARTTPIADFAPPTHILTLDHEAIAAMTPEEWDAMTRGSAMRRADFHTLAHRAAQIRDSRK